MTVILRAIRAEELSLLTGGDSEYDDFGPRGTPSGPPQCLLDGDGAPAVIVPEVPEPVGRVSWHWVRWGPTAGSRNPMIGIWVVPAHRGRGIGSAAQAELVRQFFLHTTVHRVEATTDVDNRAEQRALERAGFRREGVLRRSHWRRGAHHDMVMFSVLRGDPPPG